jgi:hypothetical protein
MPTNQQSAQPPPSAKIQEIPNPQQNRPQIVENK